MIGILLSILNLHSESIETIIRSMIVNLNVGDFCCCCFYFGYEIDPITTSIAYSIANIVLNSQAKYWCGCALCVCVCVCGLINQLILVLSYNYNSGNRIEYRNEGKSEKSHTKYQRTNKHATIFYLQIHDYFRYLFFFYCFAFLLFCIRWVSMWR